MPRFKILSSDDSYSSAEVIALNASASLNIVRELGCAEADVLQDDRYCFSIRLSEEGLWTIFQRDGVGYANEVHSYG
ncbi:MAG TPA: hypothetical protein VJM34_10305 [Novosphingobium sp.]|nr:hypothetical protein [Novosphingobium sp.]